MSNAVFYRGMLNDMDQLALLSANTWPIVLAASATYGLRAISYTKLTNDTRAMALAGDMASQMPHIVTMATDMGVPVMQIGFARRTTKKGGDRGVMFYAARTSMVHDQGTPARESDLESVNVKYMLKNVCDKSSEFGTQIERLVQIANTGTDFANPVTTLIMNESSSIRRSQGDVRIYIPDELSEELIAVVAGMKQLSDLPGELQAKQAELAGSLLKRATNQQQHDAKMRAYFTRQFWGLGCNRSFPNRRMFYAFSIDTTEGVEAYLSGKEVKELRSPTPPTAVPSLEALPDGFRDDVLGRLVMWKVRRESDEGAKLETLDEAGVFPTYSHQMQDKGTGIYLMPTRTVQWMLIPKS